jgi:hypothetical protein
MDRRWGIEADGLNGSERKNLQRTSMNPIAVLVILSILGVQQTPADLPAPVGSKPETTQPTDPLQTPPLRPDLSPTEFPRRYTKEFAAGVARGRTEADEEIKLNKARLLNYGMFIPLDQIDRETGLYHSGFGCVIDDEIVGRVEGYNARVREHIRDNGALKNSFKPWEKELFGLKTYFEDRTRTEKPTRLIDGAAVSSPDGKYSVRLISRPGVNRFGEPFKNISLVISDKNGSSEDPFFPLKDPELLWPTGDAWFAVLKGKREHDDAIAYTAIDLRGKREIRSEGEPYKFKDSGRPPGMPPVPGKSLPIDPRLPPDIVPRLPPDPEPFDPDETRGP